MDAITSNNLSRGLDAVAGTVGQYAQAQQQDQIAQSKLDFAAALQAHKDTAAAAASAQKQSNFESTQKTEQAKLDAQQKATAASQAETHSYHTQSLAAERARIANEKANSGTAHADAVTQRVLNTYQNRAEHAAALHLQAVNEMQSKMKPNPMQDPSIDAANAQITKTYQPLIDKYSAQADSAYQQYNTLQSKISGVPLDTTTPAATSPASPAAPASGTPGASPPVRYDQQGNAWTLGPDGKPIPYKPSADAASSPPAPSAPPAPAAPPAPQIAQANDPSLQGGIGQPQPTPLG